MSRRGFTLIELMVSIALTVIVVLFLYKALSNQEIANKILQKNAQAVQDKALLYELFLRDLAQAKSIKIEPLFNKNYRILYLTTTNSLHQIPTAHVAYFVHEQNRTLVRLESAYPIKLPVPSENLKLIFADPLVSGVDRFIVEEVSANRAAREPLPGEKVPPKSDQNGTKEYLLFLHWQKQKLLLDIKH